MKQIIRIAINNVLRSRFKALVIILLMALSMFVAAAAYSFSRSTTYTVDTKTEELEALSNIKILPSNQDNVIPLTTLEYIEALSGVEYVLAQYNIAGLLEEKEDAPIYPVSLNGFDFENNVFMNVIDFTGENVSGILLPDIVVNLNGEKALKDYVGKQVLFTYEYILDGQYMSETVSCNVFGVYNANGTFEENPIYMSMDLFQDILVKCSANMTGVARAEVYLDNVDATENIVNSIKELGLDVFYETTLKDYIDSLEGFINLGIVVSCIIMFFAIIVMIQAILANLRKRYTIIGVLKAYGYSNFAICFMVWLEVFIYSITALSASIITCVMLNGKLNKFFGMFMNGTEFTLDMRAIILKLIIAIVVSIVSSIIPIRRLRKINVIDVLKSN